MKRLTLIASDKSNIGVDPQSSVCQKSSLSDLDEDSSKSKYCLITGSEISKK